jgi:hypothetical protein
VISGKGRVIGGRFDDFLQTDAAINPGNSGGPVVNTRGQVIGIASAIASRSGGFQGIGFAIPSDLARPVLGQLRTAGKVTRGWLGVATQPLTAELATSFGIKVEGEKASGALVSTVVEGSPAAKAGIRPGDVIVRFDGKPVADPRVLSTVVAGAEVGKRVEVGVIRDGKPQALRVSVGDLAGSRQARAIEEPKSDGAPWARGAARDPGNGPPRRTGGGQGAHRDGGASRIPRRPGGDRPGRGHSGDQPGAGGFAGRFGHESREVGAPPDPDAGRDALGHRPLRGSGDRIVGAWPSLLGWFRPMPDGQTRS